ncbi:hypothetical protein BdWA1_000500 [Babesia duncani]|uniref:Uncharacterized protein n=1 Tax=Babesia duncani TaxID=323732 RepID=A0AAD9UQ54_9APIC|nr:hypothetical protein BdWA1_000500 [Babesia duncani]
MISTKLIAVIFTSFVCITNAADKNLGKEKAPVADTIKVITEARDVIKKLNEAAKEDEKAFGDATLAAEKTAVAAAAKTLETAYGTTDAALKVVADLPEDPKYKDKKDEADITKLQEELQTKTDTANGEVIKFIAAFLEYQKTFFEKDVKKTGPVASTNFLKKMTLMLETGSAAFYSVIPAIALAAVALA